MTNARKIALARALNTRFNTNGNIEVPEPQDGIIKIINHDDRRRNLTINNLDALERFFKTWKGPGWVVVRVDHLAKAA